MPLRCGGGDSVGGSREEPGPEDPPPRKRKSSEPGAGGLEEPMWERPSWEGPSGRDGKRLRSKLIDCNYMKVKLVMMCQMGSVQENSYKESQCTLCGEPEGETIPTRDSES
ncbi:uncharacterized protein LOC144330671 [Macaca mulatta]